MDLSTGDFAQSHDFEAEPVLEGVIESVRDIPKKGQRKATRVMTVKIKGGTLRAVWESVRLKQLFDKAKKGRKVWIAYMGRVKIKGRSQGMKEYQVALR